ALDLQYDEISALEQYWLEGSWGDEIRFYRPPFGKQISIGLSAHAELTTPIFAVNAGIGYDFLKPRGDKRFYQSLTLKTFVWRHLYLNVGYRLGDFKDPQNLMLGIGVRL
ncbi:MAG: acyloxyacyl hydrolase, partial [Muribaculaceae bacterium]|nr:acyloxyacyl hydrolase [Muribaculaceae bacterium]